MSEQGQVTAEELVIPVYLDTNVLLDLLATVEDGFSLVERVTSGQSSATTSERSAAADFGAPSVFSFFKLGLSGKLGRSATKGTNETTEAELTHTYGSLLHRLRRYLVQENLVSAMTQGQDLNAEVGNFVEFIGVVRENPFTSSFQQLQRMLRFMDVAMALEGQPQAPAQPGKANRGRSPRPPAGKQKSEMQVFGDFIEQMISDVQREGTSTVLFESEDSEYHAVVTLFDDFLRDRSMTELLNREFRVLGKVARHLRKGSDESVDLLASSGIGGFSPELLSQLTAAIDQMSVAGVAQIATPSATIEPPVIEIVPVAIYL